MHGVKIGNTQLAVIILTNIEVAATEDYDAEFKPTLQIIQQKYTYSYLHNAGSIANMLKELVDADTAKTQGHTPSSYI